MTNQIDERRAEPVTDEEVREVAEGIRKGKGWYQTNYVNQPMKEAAADLLERLAHKVKDLAAERDDAWRICATWRERAHAAEAKEIPEGHVAVPMEPTPKMIGAMMRQQDKRDYSDDPTGSKEARDVYSAMLTTAEEGSE